MLLRLFLLFTSLISVRSDSIPIEQKILQNRITLAEENLKGLKDRLANLKTPSRSSLTTCSTDDMVKLQQKMLSEYGYGNFPQKASDQLYDMCLKHLHCQLETGLSHEEKMDMVFHSIQKCTLARFRRGPYFKCIKKLGLGPNQIKTRKHSGERPSCELTDEEFLKLADTVIVKCDKDAWRDVMKNKDLVKGQACYIDMHMLKNE